MPGSPDKKQFAEITGISRNTVGSYEKPTTENQKRSTVALWASYTGYDFGWLWDGTEPDDGPESIIQRYLSLEQVA